jgi:hypothetical protein
MRVRFYLQFSHNQYDCHHNRWLGNRYGTVIEAFEVDKMTFSPGSLFSSSTHVLLRRFN